MPPSTRRVVRSVSSSVVTASRRSSSRVAAPQSARAWWLRRKMPLVDVCSSAFEATRGNFGLNGSEAVARCRRSGGKGCVRPAAILRPAPPFIDNLGRHVKCGGVLFITDLLGDVFTGSGPRCWPEFGRRWMVENGFEHVRRQTGDPCGNHYPFLFLRRKC